MAGGRVRGHRGEGLWTFLGIPYARPPEGPFRWRAPQPPEPWSGVRVASELGPIAPQTPAVPGFSLPGDPEEQSEDCLSLNVWTPDLDQPGGLGRPVMVWLHGGGFTGGTGGSLLYRGGKLARRGDVVVVTINYRLGALGFLCHPVLTGGAAATTGNWGLLDQVAALRWVRDHIADFGGDPRNVTIFGESAGGMSASALLAAPSALGLFHRAIIESGPPYAHTRVNAARIGEDLVEVLGIRSPTRERLESVPARELVAATGILQGRQSRPGHLPLPFLPVVDGVFLPRPPYESVAEGRGSPVPLLIGTNRDELTLFTLNTPGMAELDEERLGEWTSLAAPGAPPTAVIEAYRNVRASRGEPVTPRELWIAIGSDLVFRWPSLRLAAAHRERQPATFVYLFTWEAPVLGGVLGASHALEIPFVFGGLGHPAVAALSGGGPDAEALSDRMLDAWAAFARTGDPSHPGIGTWRSWDRHRRSTMVFGPGGRLVDGPRDEELAVWAESVPLIRPT